MTDEKVYEAKRRRVDMITPDGSTWFEADLLLAPYDFIKTLNPKDQTRLILSKWYLLIDENLYPIPFDRKGTLEEILNGEQSAYFCDAIFNAYIEALGDFRRHKQLH